MNAHLRSIRAILHKDLRGLMPLVILAAAVFLIQPLIATLDLLNIGGDPEFWAGVQANFYQVAYFIGMLLMISVLQLDPAASLNHDWLTRPISRLDWLLAKLLFMLLTMVVPVVLARFIINLGEGYGLLYSLTYALGVENLSAILPVPLLFAIGLLAPTLRRTIFLLVLVLLVFLIPAWSVTRPLLEMAGIDTGADFDALMWMQAMPITLTGILGALSIYWLLYCRREQKRASLVFGVCVGLVFFSVYPPAWLFNWDRAIALQKAITNSSDASLEDSVILQPIQACFPASLIGSNAATARENAVLAEAAWPERYLRAAGPGAMTFATAIRSRDILANWFSPSTLDRELNDDWRVDRIRARAWYSAGSLQQDVELERSFSAVNRLMPIAAIDTDYWLVPGEIVHKLGSDPSTRLTLQYDLALLSPTSYELATDGQRRTFPGLGSCKAELDTNTNVINIDCIKRGKQPALVSAQLISVASSRVDSATRANYLPDWLAAIGRKHYELVLASPDLADSSSIQLTAYTLERILGKQLVSEGMLGESSAICPLPTDEQNPVMEQSTWSDRSPHEVKSIAVEPDVRIEVLDWRTGAHPDAPTLFVLPGLGATVHSYDALALKLSEKYNVVGMTRRGAGNSSTPDHGYDIARLSQDVLQVLDTLVIESPILVGHSIGGEELSYLGANYPERFRALVYLDAAYDRVTRSKGADLRRNLELNRLLPSAPPSRLSAAVSYEALIQYMQRTRGNGLLPPEGEILASYDLTTGMLKHNQLYLDAIGANLQAPDYARIAVPALGIYAVPGSPAALMPAWYDQDDPDLQSRVAELFRMESQGKAAQMARFDTEVPDSQVVALEDADHWIFVSHEQQVLEAIDRFIEGIE